MKVGPGTSRAPFKYIEGQKFVDEIVERFKALREQHGSGVDIAVDFHGAVQPPTALLIVKALEPYHPWFYEEIVQALNVDVMAEIAAKTHIPIATGRAHLYQVGVQGNSRKARRPHPPARCLLCRRHHRIEDHRRHGRGLLLAAGPTQPPRALFACRESAGRRCHSQTFSSKSAATTNTQTYSPNPCHRLPTATASCPRIPASASPSTKTSSWTKSANRVLIELNSILMTGRSWIGRPEEWIQ